MNNDGWFSFGYGPEEFKRDRHAFAVIVVAWLGVDLPLLASAQLDFGTFKAHAIVAVAAGAVSFLKNLVLNNADPGNKS